MFHLLLFGALALVDAPLLAPVVLLVLCGVFNKFQLGVLLLSLFFSKLCTVLPLISFFPPL